MPLTVDADSLNRRLAALPESTLELRSPCHPDAGLALFYLGHARLRVACRVCGQWLLDILVAAPPVPDGDTAVPSP